MAALPREGILLEVTVNAVQDHLIVTKGPHTGQKIQLIKLPITIGREDSVDLPINLGSISRKHARISQVGDGYQIEDLGSSNGTFVNEERVEKTRRLADGDLIALGGDVEMKVVLPMVQKGDATAFIQPPNARPQASSEATAFGLKAPEIGRAHV